MAQSIDIEDLRKIIREFLGPKQKQFAITRDSLEIFAGVALGQLRAGVDADVLAKRAEVARERARGSARQGGSMVPGRAPPMPLLREPDASAGTASCGSFEPI